MSDPFRSGRVLVTGASGFIGSALLARLHAAGAEVHATSRQPRVDSFGTTWWQCDVTAPASTRLVLTQIAPDVVFHLGSAVTGSRALEMVPLTFQANLASTVNLLVASAETRVKRFVLAGSLEERPDADAMSAERAFVPRSPYAAAKAAASAYALMFTSHYGVPTVTLRIAMTYGPGQLDMRKLVPSVISDLLAGRSPRVASGRRIADWVFVDDVVEALLRAATANDAVGHGMDIGTGIGTSVRHVVERLVELVNPAIEPAFGALRDPPFEQNDTAETAAARRLLAWEARVPLEDGLRRTAAWYASALSERAA